MMKQVISFLGASLLAVLLLLPVQAGEMSWRARTPAGGAALVDPDYYFQFLESAEDGSKNMQITETFDGHPFKYGYSEITDNGDVVYYDLDGHRVNIRDINKILDDPDNPPNGVIYVTPPRQVVTW